MQALTLTAWLRWDHIHRLLPADAGTLLEVGAGLGGTGAMLSRRYLYTGLEPDPISYAIAATRTRGRVLQQRIEEHQGVYDIVCALEVLEHIADDVAALRLWREHSRKWLLLSVPMNPNRFGSVDERVGHYRRYSRASLAHVLTESGWTPCAINTYGFPIGYVLEGGREFLARGTEQKETMLERTNASGRWLQPPETLAFSTWVAALPFRVLQRPFLNSNLGTGLIALAQR